MQDLNQLNEENLSIEITPQELAQLSSLASDFETGYITNPGRVAEARRKKHAALVNKMLGSANQVVSTKR